MLAFLHRGRWGWCALVVTVAAALYLPGLDSFGFWDPYELDVVDRVAAGSASDAAPLTGWLVGAGLDGLGEHELGGRLPLALIGIAIAFCTFVWVRAAAGARAATLAALFVLAAPLMVVQSRQLTGSAGIALGQLLMVTGGGAALWARRPWHLLAGVAAAVTGIAVAYFAAGALLGVAVALAALGAGCVAARRYRSAVVIGLATAGVLATVGAGAMPFGRVRPAPRYDLSWGPLAEQIAFGAFPWIALVPAGLARCLRAREPRRAFSAYVAASWAVLAFVACAVIEVGPFRACYPAIPALALFAAVSLEHLAVGRERVATGAVVLAILVVALLARDLAAFPDRIATLSIAGAAPAHAGSVGWLQRAPVAIGSFAAVALVIAALARGLPRRLAAASVVSASLAFGWVVAFAWLPAVGRNTSNMLLFERYLELRAPGEVLVVLGRSERAARHYVPEHRTARGPGEVVEMFTSPERAFALVPRASVCTVWQNTRAAGGSPVVVDDSEAFSLMSNLYRSGEPRAAGFDGAISTVEPAPQRAVTASFGNELELIGVDMPARVGRGDDFAITLYYRVVKRPRRAWRIFLHFDRPGGRFQGDHPPLGGDCATNQWNPGDYIIDRHRMSAGDITHGKGRYDVWTGLFVGGNGKWTNMDASAERVDGADRVHIGTIEVR